jgi:hypothetical protein
MKFRGRDDAEHSGVVFFWKYWFIDWVVVKFSFLLVWGLVGKSVLTKWTESS